MDKVIIVTGGAKGIGKSIVYELAMENTKIILNYNTSKDLAVEIQNDFKSKNIDIDIYRADVSKREEVIEMLSYVKKKYNKIDCIINNAGISQFKVFTDITDEDWNMMLKNNLNSVFYMSQEASKYMINQKNGLIINISSIWGQVGASCESHYAVSKAGVDALTKSLAKELGPSNIRVNSIAPGIIDTNMNSRLTKKELEDIKEEIPLGRIGKGRDVAKCVKWLLEDEYVTGQIISVNGGWLL